MSESKVKLDSSRSQFGVKADKKEGFEQRAASAADRDSTIKAESVEITSVFQRLLSETKLQKNRGPLDKSLEQEAIFKIIDFSVRVNNDETQPEGYGSSCVSALLLRAILFQRDRLNELSFKNAELEKTVQSLSVIVEELRQK